MHASSERRKPTEDPFQPAGGLSPNPHQDRAEERSAERGSRAGSLTPGSRRGDRTFGF